MRYAVVQGKRDVVEAYLPVNFSVLHDSALPGGFSNLVIGGEDWLGWSLDEYVLPRLRSGNISAREYPTYEAANEAAAASMN